MRTQEGKLKSLPPYMLLLRDPANETHDLGCKAIAIKHLQTTFKALAHQYMLNKERRQKLQDYGRRIGQQVVKTLAAKARQVRESDGMKKG
jgi:non-canonical poly(A) RNA polymerase PAPD5/7